MTMDDDKKRLKNQLDRELATVRFTNHQQVLEKIGQPLTWRKRLHILWNKEIEVPVLPLGATLLAIFLFFSAKELVIQEKETEYKELVSIGTYIYWKDEVGKLVNEDEG